MRSENVALVSNGETARETLGFSQVDISYLMTKRTRDPVASQIAFGRIARHQRIECQVSAGLFVFG